MACCSCNLQSTSSNNQEVAKDAAETAINADAASQLIQRELLSIPPDVGPDDKNWSSPRIKGKKGENVFFFLLFFPSIARKGSWTWAECFVGRGFHGTYIKRWKSYSPSSWWGIHGRRAISLSSKKKRSMHSGRLLGSGNDKRNHCWIDPAYAHIWRRAIQLRRAVVLSVGSGINTVEDGTLWTKRNGEIDNSWQEHYDKFLLMQLLQICIYLNELCSLIFLMPTIVNDDNMSKGFSD